MRNDTQPQSNELPPDRCGVHIENSLDEKRLAYLLSQVGEEKVRRTAMKYQARYPDSRIYVSRLLKIYRIQLPSSIYHGDE